MTEPAKPQPVPHSKAPAGTKESSSKLLWKISVLEAKLGLKTTIKNRRLSAYNHSNKQGLNQATKVKILEELNELREQYAQNQKFHDLKELAKQVKVAKSLMCQRIARKLKSLQQPAEDGTAPPTEASTRIKSLEEKLAFCKKLDPDLLLERTCMLHGLALASASPRQKPSAKNTPASFTAEQEMCIMGILTLPKLDQFATQLKHKKYGTAILPHAEHTAKRHARLNRKALAALTGNSSTTTDEASSGGGASEDNANEGNHEDDDSASDSGEEAGPGDGVPAKSEPTPPQDDTSEGDEADTASRAASMEVESVAVSAASAAEKQMPSSSQPTPSRGTQKARISDNAQPAQPAPASGRKGVSAAVGKKAAPSRGNARTVAERGRGRAAGAERGGKQVAKKPPPPRLDAASIHPSWAARRAEQQRASAIDAFAGTKITFGDDDE